MKKSLIVLIIVISFISVGFTKPYKVKGVGFNSVCFINNSFRCTSKYKSLIIDVQNKGIGMIYDTKTKIPSPFFHTSDGRSGYNLQIVKTGKKARIIFNNNEWIYYLVMNVNGRNAYLKLEKQND